MTTLIMDTNWGCKLPRWAVCTIVTIISALISLIYCTEFGLQALDAVDTAIHLARARKLQDFDLGDDQVHRARGRSEKFAAG